MESSFYAGYAALSFDDSGERVKSHEILMLKHASPLSGALHYQPFRGIGMFDGENWRADVCGSKPEKDASLRCAYAYLLRILEKAALTVKLF